MFQINEENPDLVIYKEYGKYTFPTYMTVSGRHFSGVTETLNKPHGEKDVMEFMIGELVGKDKQFSPFIKNIMRRGIVSDIDSILEILVLDGIIQIVYRNERPTKGLYWNPKVIQLDPRALIQKPLTNKEKRDNDFQVFKEMTVSWLGVCDHPLQRHILYCLNSGKLTDSEGNVVATALAHEKFVSIAITLAWFINLKESNEQLPLRVLSYEIWKKPGILSKYRSDAAKVAGILVADIDKTLLPDINNEVKLSLITVAPIKELYLLFEHQFSLLGDGLLTIEIKDYMHKIDHCIDRLLMYLKEINLSELSEAFIIRFEQAKSNLEKNRFQESRDVIRCILENDIPELQKKMLKMDSRLKQKSELIILEEIGAGSFAKVYRVYDPSISKQVACKVLFSKADFLKMHGNEGHDYLLRFKREVRLMQEINHQAIIKALTIQIESSPYWFTMPLAQCSLDKWIQENHNASENIRLQIFHQIIDGVEHLHSVNKFHRDLAPNNILLFVTTEGIQVKIADLGLAKDPLSISFQTSISAKNYGQRSFTDPEQLSDFLQSDHLSDIYSLGALLYYVLSGQAPEYRFQKTVKYQPIVSGAMKSRMERYQSVGEFKVALEKMIQNSTDSNIVSFYRVNSYEYAHNMESDSLFVLGYLNQAQVEPVDLIYSNFIVPLLSIPQDIFRICCKYEEVITPFLEIVKSNIENLDLTRVEVSDRNKLFSLLQFLYYELSNDGAKVVILKVLLEQVLIYHESSAKPQLIDLICSLREEPRITDLVVVIIKNEYSDRLSDLKDMLVDKNYPTALRFAIGDF